MTSSHGTSDAWRPAPTALTARNPEDLLAMAPVLLGFWPEEDVVMLTFGADRPFHARIDLPPIEDQTPERLAELRDLLLGPARDHRAQLVVLLYFTTDRAAARGAHRVLREGCRRSRLPIVTALVADGRRFSEADGPMGAGTPYDVSTHPFVVGAVVNGRITHRNREELVASLEPDPGAVAAVQSALASGGLLEDDLPVDGRSIRREGRWVERRVADLVAAGTVPSDGDVARLLWVMQAIRVRDAAWSLIRRDNAAAHVRFWAPVVRRAPDPLVAAPAALLGWASWQAGDGARAWTAVDRCLRVVPDYAMAVHLGALLEHAVPPDFWEGGFDWALGLPALLRRCD
ncbi:MAG: DUF4192 domain-containing protein [Propionibacteriales bacterium]|nr:DUF4192 domain-containing protein [Propionibacteriales bacterium]